MLNNRRIQQLKKALRTSNKPQRDECDDWNIFGKHGKIYIDNTYWYVMAEGQTSVLKTKLSCFMTLWQGDFIYRSNKFPDSERAEIIREVVGLNKKRVLSPEQRERLAKVSEKYRWRPAPPALN